MCRQFSDTKFCTTSNSCWHSSFNPEQFSWSSHFESGSWISEKEYGICRIVGAILLQLNSVTSTYERGSVEFGKLRYQWWWFTITATSIMLIQFYCFEPGNQIHRFRAMNSNTLLATDCHFIDKNYLSIFPAFNPVITNMWAKATQYACLRKGNFCNMPPVYLQNAILVRYSFFLCSLRVILTVRS